jgi:hypothetical protein
MSSLYSYYLPSRRFQTYLPVLPIPAEITQCIYALHSFSTVLTNNKIGTYMSRAVLTGLQNWLKDTVAVWPHAAPSPADHYAIHVYDTFYHQDDIGWSNMFRSRISTTWIKAYAIHSESLSLDRQKFRSHILGPTLNEKLWSLSLTLWKECCDAMYGLDGLLTLCNIEELTSKIVTAYKDPTPIPLTL